MADIPKISFNGGVISPQAFARVDLAKFGSAAKVMDEFFVHAEGGASNRAGTEFIKEVKDSASITRTITFEFNAEQSYALEFSNLAMRVYQDGAVLVEATTAITGATQANPVVVTDVGHGYSNGDQIFIADVVGMTELNSKFYTLANVAANTYELVGIDGTGYTAYISGGTAARVFTLVTPYLDTELAALKYRQSNDVMYLSHRNHPPAKIIRAGASLWTYTVIDFEPDHLYPTGVTVTPAVAGAVTYRYRVTAVALETAEESLVGLDNTTMVITGATQADPVVITSNAHGLANGDEVQIDAIVGMTELNGRRFTAAGVAANTYQLKDEDGTGYTAYVSGGTANRTFTEITNGVTPPNNAIAYTEVDGTEFYNFYKEDNGLYGFIGSSELASFTDNNLAPDLNDTAPKWRQPFATAGNYPGAVGLHEQRSAWANTDNDPLAAWLSQTSQFENMNVSSPTKATDAITLRLITGQGNEIRHFRSFQDRLFTFTSGSVWTIRPGGNADAITPDSKLVSIEEYLSSTDVPPLTIKKNILMIAGKANQGFEVHSLGYQLETDAYVGSDLTVLARNLFVGYTLSEWAFAERPYRLVACIRSDGKVVVMSYLQEHQVFAWSVWDLSGGIAESICSVPEGQEDAFYFVVKRTINGQEVRYIERLHSRQFSSIEDAFFVDSGLTIDNPIDITGATQANPVVITAVGHGLANGTSVKIRDVVGMVELNKFNFTIANVTANTFELVDTDGTSYTAYVSGGTVRENISVITGLDHLEGEAVLALADGNVDSTAYEASTMVVTDGQVTLTNPASIIHIGLPWTGTLTSLPLNLAVPTTSRRKVVKSVTTRVENTRGLKVGPDVDNLESYPARSTELWGDPAAVISDLIKIPISDDWDREAGVTYQTEPGLPMTILSMFADTDVGE